MYVKLHEQDVKITYSEILQILPCNSWLCLSISMFVHRGPTTVLCSHTAYYLLVCVLRSSTALRSLSFRFSRLLYLFLSCVPFPSLCWLLGWFLDVVFITVSVVSGHICWLMMLGTEPPSKVSVSEKEWEGWTNLGGFGFYFSYVLDLNGGSKADCCRFFLPFLLRCNW